MPVVKDPFLDSINHMLMEEGMEDATYIQQVCCDTSYQAILCSFYDIIGEHPPPEPSLVSTSLCDLHIPHQITEEEHVDLHKFNILMTHQMLNAGASRVTLPSGNAINLQSSFFQQEIGDSRPVHAVPGLVQHFISHNSTDLNALNTTKAQHHHAAIKFNEREVSDTKVSCWEKGTTLNNFSACSGRGSNAHFQLPSPYKELSLKLTGVDLSFEDLNLHNHYAALYVGGQPGIPAGHPKYRDKEKALAVAGKGGKFGKKRTANAEEYVDLKGLMVNYGQAVAVGDARIANELLQGILHQVHGASAYGNGLQRAAHYFSEALVARMRGTGGHECRATFHLRKPSLVTYLKTFKSFFDVSPIMQVTQYFANQSILKAAEGASRLHIVDYGIEECGIQWSFLINALADQKGGPPLLVITGIDSPQQGHDPAGRLEESGRRLAAHARTYNVPFQYHAIASSKWEDLDSSSFHFHYGEVLVVNCSYSLRLLSDDGVDLVSPRQKFLRCIHCLKPHLLIIADLSTAFNSTCFVSRFREALYYYSSSFEMLDTVWGDIHIPERLLLERMCYSVILNIVACEGAERVERAEPYKQWQVCIKRAAFEQLLIPPAILRRSKSHVKQHYHKDFFVHVDDDNKWMLSGWRGRTLVAVSTWKLSNTQLSWEEG